VEDNKDLLWSSIDVVVVVPHGRVVIPHGHLLSTNDNGIQPDSDDIVSCHCQTSACCIASTLSLLVWLVTWHCIILVVLV